MNFRMDMSMPAAPEAVWPLFFDVARVARLIPGCEQVQEKEPLVLYSAVMKQKVGPFKMEAPAEVRVEEMIAPSRVRARAKGRDRITGTTMDVLLDVSLAGEGTGTRLVVDSTMVVAGRLASLGYAVVKKKADEMFAEFERRLRAELEGIPSPQSPVPDPSSPNPLTPSPDSDAPPAL
ncbi:MAG TPA: SRPBCC domain-containing protein [Usitatibacter sp.]|nr:SRPBCC domain-containing protein [Usitatibacter sp.]